VTGLLHLQFHKFVWEASLIQLYSS
jgi:hypothetical protein